MIGKICGVFSGYYKNIALIDIHTNDCSVGYEVIMKTSDILSLNVGEKVIVYIKEIIKEDEDSYYGFLNFEEKCFFEEFIKLSSLGPKIALAILSTYSCDLIVEAIRSNNCDFFASISGIGNKLANRIPNEMLKNIDKINEKVLSFSATNKNIFSTNVKKDKQAKLLDIKEDNFDLKTKKNAKQTKAINQEQVDKNIINDAVNALIVLGFSKQQVYNDVFNIVKDKNIELTTENIVKEFLKKSEK